MKGNGTSTPVLTESANGTRAGEQVLRERKIKALEDYKWSLMCSFRDGWDEGDRTDREIGRINAAIAKLKASGAAEDHPDSGSSAERSKSQNPAIKED